MQTHEGFSCQITQEEWLPRDAELVEALITVEAEGIADAARARASSAGGVQGAEGVEGTGAEGARAAVVVVIDRSESMGWPPARLPAAKTAAAAAVGLVRDGVHFAVVAGNKRAAMVYPTRREMVAASARTRREAVDHIAALDATGETKISEWLRLARELFAPYPRAIRHALLFTDGKNQSEERPQLERVLESCRGEFRCDARGVGADWDREEVRHIAEELQGSADAVPQASALEAELSRLMEDAMHSAVPDVLIRLRPRKGVRLRYLRQHFPSVVDLTAHGVSAGAAATDYSTGPWGDGTRQYRLCFETDPDLRVQGEAVRLARVELMVRGVGEVEAVGAGEAVFVVGQWSPDRPRPTRMTTHFTRQQELGDLLLEGGKLWRAGDRSAAAQTWGRAAEQARGIDNESVLARLGRVLEPVGPGAVPRLKSGVTAADVLYVEMGEAVPTYLRPDDSGADVSGLAADAGPSGAAASPVDSRRCTCGWISPPNARYCSKCGRPLTPYVADDGAGGRP